MARLQAHGVGAGVVQDIRDLLENDTSYRERHVRFIRQPDAAVPITVHGETIRISGLEPTVERAPMLGEHNEYVLKEVLGMEEAAIEELRESGVLR
jgi:crotonobetainyl-CoA:carnitine CoA-transferase CaiB-like acyl-CoA transferase